MVFIKPIICVMSVITYKSQDKNIRHPPISNGWLRSQEEYDQSNNDTLLPPLTLAELPRPFASPPPARMTNKTMDTEDIKSKPPYSFAKKPWYYRW